MSGLRINREPFTDPRRPTLAERRKSASLRQLAAIRRMQAALVDARVALDDLGRGSEDAFADLDRAMAEYRAQVSVARACAQELAEMKDRTEGRAMTDRYERTRDPAEGEGRAITAVQVTLFGRECFLPADIAQEVEQACAAQQQGQAVATVAGEFSEVRQDGEVYWLQTVLLKQPQQLPFGAPLYTAPQQPAPKPDAAAYRDCCDTPAYCSSVRRCTAKDGKQPDAVAGLVEEVARTIYDEWRDKPGFVGWVEGGNSDMQDQARFLARGAINRALATQHQETTK